MQKISVITVCYNAANTIEETIKSVLSQTYSNIEYIIIDGGSKDGTLDIIQKYKSFISVIISEPDKGIYDAMNKGVKHSSGEWINFMNAGDKFYSANTVEKIFCSNHQANRVIYGSTLMKFSYGNYIVKPDKLESIINKMTMCHQSIFVKRSESIKHPFKDQYGLVADHGSLIEIYAESHIGFEEVPFIIAVYDAKDGVTSVNALKGYRHQVNLTHSKDSIFRQFRVYVRAFMPNWVKKPLGRFYFYFNARYKRVKY